MRTNWGRLPLHGLLLLALVLAALAVRIAFLNGRWINPDEGAHLMDGLLILDGFVPIVDYHSRQVLYTYVLGFFLRVAGVSYEMGRFYPVLATVGVGLLVYLIAGRLFDRRVALLAAAIYLFLPFAIVYGTHVKTEPLTILLSCLGIYALLVALDRNDGLPFFFLAGVSFGLGYYVRQSALALLLAAVLIAIVLIRQRGRALRASAGVVGGFAVVCTVFMVTFATMLPASRVLFSGSLNPAAFAVRMAQPGWQAVAGSQSAGGQGAGEAMSAAAAEDGDDAAQASSLPGQPRAETMFHIIRSARLNSFLLVGLFLSPVFLWWRRGSQRPRRRGDGTRAAAVLYAWLGTLFAAYAFYSVVRGFFPAYFGEFLPPLSILAAVVALDAVGRLRGGRGAGLRDLLAFGAVALGFVLLHTVAGPLALNRPLYYTIVPAILALVYLGRRLEARYLAALAALAVATAGTILLAPVGGMLKLFLYGLLFLFVFGVLFAACRLDPRTDPARAGAFVCYSLLVSTFVLWLGRSHAEIDRAFGGMWPPATVSEVAAYLEEHTDAGDEVISGAVIWEFEAKRRPFMLLSHPLGFRGGIPRERLRAMEQRLQERPPPVIILDGYTERTYEPYVPSFTEVLNTRYRLERVVEGALYPVAIYRLDHSVAPTSR